MEPVTTQASGGPSRGGPPLLRIPKRIHWVWMGSQIPERCEIWLERWVKLHPGWDFCAWNEDNIRTMLPPALLGLVDNAGHLVKGNQWQFVSDIVRYALMFNYGGVYVDVDTEPRKSLGDLCEVDCWFGWEQDNKWVGNTYIGSRPGHPFFARLINGLETSAKLHRGKSRANLVSGPVYVTRQLKGYSGPQVTVYPQAMLYPYSHDELHRQNEAFPEAYAVHHWANARRKAKVAL